MIRIALIVEAGPDERSAIILADRILDPISLQNQKKHHHWMSAETWKGMAKKRRSLGRKTHGQFEGQPGDCDAGAARGALLILKEQKPDAILLLRDAEEQAEGRRRGLEQAREEECLKDPSLELLCERGKNTGLPEFLEEIRERFAPLFSPLGG